VKASEIKDLSPEELQQKLSDLDKERFNLRFQLAMGDIENPIRIRDVKRDIARIKTVLKQKEIGG
jgi:large subunit ribosomal protein L29